MLYFNEALNDIFVTLNDHHGNTVCFEKEHETENTFIAPFHSLQTVWKRRYFLFMFFFYYWEARHLILTYYIQHPIYIQYFNSTHLSFCLQKYFLKYFSLAYFIAQSIAALLFLVCLYQYLTSGAKRTTPRRGSARSTSGSLPEVPAE